MQGGNVSGFGGYQLSVVDNFNLGPSLVRGFAPGGIGPRDMSVQNLSIANALGGTNYIGGTAEVQFPIFGVPKDVGLRGALFADAGTLYGYAGKTNFTNLFPVGSPTVGGCVPATFDPTGVYAVTQGSCLNLGGSQDPVLRASVGASLLWASPVGPIRFDYAWVLKKATGDITQAFRFTGGGAF